MNTPKQPVKAVLSPWGHRINHPVAGVDFVFRGTHVKKKKGAALDPEVFYQYGLLNDFSEASYSNKNVVQRLPKAIVLSDWHAWLILNGGLADSGIRKL